MPPKVQVLDLKVYLPDTNAALRAMERSLVTCKRGGTKAVIFVHGYGSSGVGGSLKSAVRKGLGDRALIGIVRASAGGEEWTQRKREMLELCPALSEQEQYIAGNDGVTVVILKR